MLAVLLFNIIVAISITALFVYYYSASPFTPKPQSQDEPDLTDKDLFESDKRTGAVSSVGVGGGEQTDVAEHSLYKSFNPDDADVHYRNSTLTELSLNDLEYTLNELAHPGNGVATIIDQLSNPNLDPDQLVLVSTQNFEITKKVLQIANSEFLGREEQIDDLATATNWLGRDDLKMLVHVAGLYQKAKDRPGPIDPEDLFNHSLSAAQVTSWLAGRSKTELRTELAGMAAILHDLGKIVLRSWRPEAFRRALRNAKEKNISLLETELDEIGITHALAGNLLLERWRIPKSVKWVAMD